MIERAFVGRTAELAALTTTFTTPDAPWLLLVEGPAGIGKSRLIAHFAHTAPCRVIVVTGAEDARTQPRYLADDITDQLTTADPTFAAAEAAADAAARVSAPEEPPTDPARSTVRDADGRVSVVAVIGRTDADPGRWLRSALGEVETLLVVDDVQWADSESVRVLADLIRKRPAGLRVLLGCRSGSCPAAISRLWGAPRVRAVRVLVPPFTQADVAGLLPEQDARRRERLLIASRGNPLYLSLLAGLSERALERALSGADPDPSADDYAALDRTIRAELAELPAVERLVAQAVAVCGVPPDLELVCATADLGTEVVVAGLDGLVTRGVAGVSDGAVAFTHPLVRTAAYRLAPPGWRAMAHRRAALTLRARDAPMPARARHLEHALLGADELAGAELRLAAGQVLADAPEASARWLATARRLAPAATDPLADALALGRALLLSGAAARAGEELAPVAETTGPHQLEALLLSARCARMLGRVDQARALLGTAASLPRRPGDGPVQLELAILEMQDHQDTEARTRLATLFTAPAHTDPAVAVPAHADPAVAAPAHADPAVADPAVVASAVSADPAVVSTASVDLAVVASAVSADPVVVSTASVDPALVPATVSADRAVVAAVTALRCLSLLADARFAEAGPHYDGCAVAFAALDDAGLREIVHAVPAFGWCAYFLDRDQDGLRLLDRAIAVSRRFGRSYALAELHTVRAYSLAKLGRLTESLAAADDATESATTFHYPDLLAFAGAVKLRTLQLTAPTDLTTAHWHTVAALPRPAVRWWRRVVDNILTDTARTLGLPTPPPPTPDPHPGPLQPTLLARAAHTALSTGDLPTAAALITRAERAAGIPPIPATHPGHSFPTSDAISIEAAPDSAHGDARGGPAGDAQNSDVGAAPGSEVGVARGSEVGVAHGSEVADARGGLVGVPSGSEVGVAHGSDAGVAHGGPVEAAPGSQVGAALLARAEYEAAVGAWDSAAAAATAAARAFGAAGMVVHAAQAELVGGISAGRRGDFGAATGRFAAARAVFAEAGAQRLLAETITAQRSLAGRQRPGTATLTRREREVAELAAHGHSNKDIAAHLYLSPRTVEDHLGRVLRKLGLTGRAGIARKLAELDTPTPIA
ncbi:AAA family ATPase [Nocardia sp. SSK8]|uniref:AAA family ATPase n=1 Tax=Nocardia sp. SSK8 TaxID=3120154 RepID=UPI00300AC47F